MKTRSAKNKGCRLQNELRVKLLQEFKELEPDDCVCAIMGQSGTDIKLSPAAKRLIPYAFECKNQEKLSIWSALKQAEDNAGDATPALVFTRNRTKTYVAIDLDSFLKIIRNK